MNRLAAPAPAPAPIPPAAPLRLRRRLTLAFILVAAVAATTLAAGSYLFIQHSWLEESHRRAGDDATRQLSLAEQFLPDPDRLASLRDSFAGSRRDVVLVVDGEVAASNPAMNPPLPQPLRESVASGQLAYQRLEHDGHRLLVVGGRIGGAPDQLYLVVSEQRIHDDLAQLRTVLLGGALAIIVLAAGIGYALARRTLEPVSRASAAAHALADGLLDTRLPVQTRDEFGAWAASFNRMAAALESKIDALSQAQQRERRFTGDVAHELRTPVAALVAEASLLREQLASLPEAARRPAELLVGDVLRLRRLVDDLLEIARLDGGGEQVRSEPVALATLVQAVIGAGGWQEQVGLSGPDLVVEADPRRVERVVANLVANAVRYAGGGHVWLWHDPAAVCVEVADDGPGIPAAHLPRLFDRFYKADAARTGGGSGLGLAIAREHARLMGGDITVTSREGAGARFRLTLPARGAVTRLLPAGEAPVGLAADAREHTAHEGGTP